jgi:hypothetical protein
MEKALGMSPVGKIQSLPNSSEWSEKERVVKSVQPFIARESEMFCDASRLNESDYTPG